jgi:hypothetical protein
MLGLVVTGQGLEVGHAGSVLLVREARLRQRGELGRVRCLELNSLVDSVALLGQTSSLDVLKAVSLLWSAASLGMSVYALTVWSGLRAWWLIRLSWSHLSIEGLPWLRPLPIFAISLVEGLWLL